MHIFEHLNLLTQVWPTNRPTFWRTYLHMTWVGARDACASKKSSTSVWTELVCLCPENAWQSWKEETRVLQSKSTPSLTLSLVTYMQHGLAGRRADLVQVLASHLHWLPTAFQKRYLGWEKDIRLYKCARDKIIQSALSSAYHHSSYSGNFKLQNQM